MCQKLVCILRMLKYIIMTLFDYEHNTERMIADDILYTNYTINQFYEVMNNGVNYIINMVSASLFSLWEYNMRWCAYTAKEQL